MDNNLELAFKLESLLADDEFIDGAAADVHKTYVASKLAAGITSRIFDQTGEELMVDYDKLSETAKELDRVTVVTGIQSAVNYLRGGA